MIAAAFLALEAATTVEDVVRAAQSLEAAGVTAVGLLDGADTGLGPTPFESTTIAARVAAATSSIGVIASDSALYSFPYHSARRLATLDHLSEGCSGWLVRASTGKDEATAYAWRSALGRGEELHRATEYIEIERELWDSWEDGAQWPDKASGDFKDDSRIHRIEYRSTSFRVSGPLDTPPSPQRRPVLFSLVSAPDQARALTPYLDVVILAPAEGAALDELAATVASTAEAAGVRVLRLVAGATGGLLGLPPLADVVASATDHELDGVALVATPTAAGEIGSALAGADLPPATADGTLAARLGIELVLGGLVA